MLTSRTACHCVLCPDNSDLGPRTRATLDMIHRHGWKMTAIFPEAADNDVMTRWFRSHWAEEDTWFYCEVDDKGWVTRQAELQGPLQRPITAASMAEWQAAQQAGTLADYEATFGATAEVPVQEWEARAPQALTAAEFETVWRTARATCQARARARSAHTM
ncbi:hypothetical protein ACFXAW_31155 [Streptomyces sp. NPDC059445]|uniref:hypothetical protein n=1 Tax=Streptomyces sp. NPDC059445 TaxID=3346832 RepID=UPI0036C0F2AA